jgi:CheY-like chemotaxis protein
MSLPINLLLVDDNQHMRKLLREMLKAIGIDSVREASDPVEAFECMTTMHFDLLIVDLSMPMIDGIEFIKMIRTGPDSQNPFMPILMVTGHSERSKVIGARDAGVNEFMVKPVTAKNLLLRIQSIIDNPRPFIRTTNYFGPDRRRVQKPNYEGPWRRKDDIVD